MTFDAALEHAKKTGRGVRHDGMNTGWRVTWDKTAKRFWHSHPGVNGLIGFAFDDQDRVATWYEVKDAQP